MGQGGYLTRQYIFHDKVLILNNPKYPILDEGGHSYEDLKNKLIFPEDHYGVSNWVMRFPLAIYSANLAEKHIFTEDKVEVVKASGVNLDEKWKHFVMTREDGSRCYCTYHIFYDKGPLRGKKAALFSGGRSQNSCYSEFYLPKCLVLMCDLPYFKIMINLIKVHRQLRRNSSTIPRCINERMLSIYEELVMRNEESAWNNLKVHSLGLGKNIPCPIEVVFSYYIDTCNKYRVGQSIYICPEKKTQILHLYTLNNQSLFNFNYIMHLPISGKTLELAIAGILQEKQVIFTSNNQNSNLMLMQSLLQMIKPLKWDHMYVPNLPEDMLDAAEESFMPYLVGLHNRFLNKISKAGRIIIYVDKNQVEYSKERQNHDPDHPFYDLPEQLCGFLTYEKKSGSQYLEWEKQVRTKALLLMMSILSKAPVNSQQQQSSAFTKKSLTPTTMYNKLQSTPYLLPKKNINYQTNYQIIDPFYNNLFTKSMLFARFQEDCSKGLMQECSELLATQGRERMQIIRQRLHQLTVQSMHPVVYDNTKEWTRYYYNYQEKNRKARDFRQSLVSAYSVPSLHLTQSSPVLTDQMFRTSMVTNESGFGRGSHVPGYHSISKVKVMEKEKPNRRSDRKMMNLVQSVTYL